MSGAMFETFVVSEIIKSYVHNAKTPNIYYYRDKDKKEIDVSGLNDEEVEAISQLVNILKNK